MDRYEIQENDIREKVLSLENGVNELKKHLAEVIEGRNRVAIVCIFRKFR